MQPSACGSYDLIVVIAYMLATLRRMTPCTPRSRALNRLWFGTRGSPQASYHLLLEYGEDTP
jgi:hypothetical protein